MSCKIPKFLQLALDGCIEQVLQEIHNGTDPNMVDDTNKGLIYYTACSNNPKLLKTLIQHNYITPTQIQSFTFPPVNSAPCSLIVFLIQQGYIEMVKTLLELNIIGDGPYASQIYDNSYIQDPSTPNVFDIQSLYEFTLQCPTLDQTFAMMSLLHEYGIDVNERPILDYLAYNGKLDEMKYLIKLGANPRAKFKHSTPQSPIFTAILNDQVDVVDYLLTLYERDENGQVAKKKMFDILKLENPVTKPKDQIILPNAPNMTIIQQEMYTPLKLAIKYRAVKVFQLFIEKYQFDINYRTPLDGQTLLHLWARYTDFDAPGKRSASNDMFTYIYTKSVPKYYKIDVADANFLSPLYWTLIRNQIEPSKLLVKYNANPRIIRSRNNGNIFHAIASVTPGINKATFQYIMSFPNLDKTCINEIVYHPLTPIQWAIHYQHETTITWLLEQSKLDTNIHTTQMTSFSSPSRGYKDRPYLDGANLLHLAAYGKLHIFQYILKNTKLDLNELSYGPTQCYDVLCTAIWRDNVDIVRWLYQHWKELKIKKTSTAIEMPLHIATLTNAVKCIELFVNEFHIPIDTTYEKEIGRGENYQQFEQTGILQTNGFTGCFTPLGFGIIYGKYEAVQKLLELGANATILDKQKRNIFHLFGEQGEVVDIPTLQLISTKYPQLLQQKSLPYGYTPIRHATQSRLFIALHQIGCQFPTYQDAMKSIGASNGCFQVPLLHGFCTGVKETEDECLEMIKYYVEQCKMTKNDIGINNVDMNGYTALQYAAISNRINTMKYLIQHGAQLHNQPSTKSTKSSSTLLHDVIYEQCELATIEYVLQLQHRVNGKMVKAFNIDDGIQMENHPKNVPLLTPAMYAYGQDRYDVVKLLIKYGAKTDFISGLIDRAISEHLTFPCQSIEGIFEIDSPLQLFSIHGLTLIEGYIMNDNVEKLKYFLNHKNPTYRYPIDQYNPNNTMSSLLHVATRFTAHKCMKYLITDKKMSINFRANNGPTPFQYAISNNNIYGADLVLQYKPNLYLPLPGNTKGENLLHWCADTKTIEFKTLQYVIRVYESLLTTSTSLSSNTINTKPNQFKSSSLSLPIIHSRTHKYTTPICYAISSGRIEIMKYLHEEYDASLTIHDINGFNLYHYAAVASAHNIEFIEYLDEYFAKHKINITLQDTSLDGQTPLSMAIDEDNTIVIEYLKTKM